METPIMGSPAFARSWRGAGFCVVIPIESVGQIELSHGSDPPPEGVTQIVHGPQQRPCCPIGAPPNASCAAVALHNVVPVSSAATTRYCVASTRRVCSSIQYPGPQ